MTRQTLTPEFKQAAHDWVHDAYRLSAITRLGGYRMAMSIDAAVSDPRDQKKLRAIAIIIGFEGEIFQSEVRS